jgi:hypothetical protein
MNEFARSRFKSAEGYAPKEAAQQTALAQLDRASNLLGSEPSCGIGSASVSELAEDGVVPFLMAGEAYGFTFTRERPSGLVVTYEDLKTPASGVAVSLAFFQHYGNATPRTL